MKLGAEAALDLFEEVARKYLAAFDRNTCIEQTRILIEVLRRFDIQAEPLATKLHLLCKDKDFQYFMSGDERDRQNAMKLARGFIQRRNDAGDVLGYHTVALVERRVFVDLTLAQCESPEFGFQLDPQMLVVPFPHPLKEGCLADIGCSGVSSNGVPFDVRWISVPDRGWERTEAWEPSHLWPLIGLIVQEMRERIRGAA